MRKHKEHKVLPGMLKRTLDDIKHPRTIPRGIGSSPGGGGGGGGTQIWFRRGCAAEAAKPVPIFKGPFGGKGYPLLGGFYSRKLRFCVL